MVTVREHLKNRHVCVSRYSIHIDEVNRTATFLLFNLSGQICGYQRYRPDANKTKSNDPRLSRYYTFRPSIGIGVFGLETISYSRTVFVTEGIFDAVRLHNLGFTAIAALSNDPKFLQPWLRTLSRPTVAVCDWGRPGEKLALYTQRAITCPEGMDLGAMKTEDISAMILPCV